MIKELRITLRFVSLIAIPLCFVNSFIIDIIPSNFISGWLSRFFFSLFITFPQAVVYVSIVKWLDRKKRGAL